MQCKRNVSGIFKGNSVFYMSISVEKQSMNCRNHKMYFIDNVNINDCDLIHKGLIIAGFISECISNQEVV